MECKGCHNLGGYLRHELILCDNCFKRESGKLMTKTATMSEWALSQKDLDGLEHALGYNTYSREYNVKLYLVEDVKSRSIEKYGSLVKVKNKLEDRTNRIEQKQESLKKLKEYRRKELDEHLKSICLPGIRNDSAICDEYIEKGDKSRWSIREIGAIMTKMDFLYKHTQYSKYLKDIRRDYDRYRFNNYYEEEVRQRATKQAIKEYVRLNFDNMNKINEEVPESLRETINNYSAKLYEEKIKKWKTTNNWMEDQIKKNKQILKESKKIKKNNNYNYSAMNLNLI